jgi:shikimate dehydrogenase
VDERHRIGGSTHLAGVIGWPIDHSLSPVIHNAAYEALGLDWVYVALPVGQGAVGAALEGLEGLGLAGANVTMPHKETVAATLEALSDDAALLRAVNTIHATPAGLVGQ